MLAGHGSTRDGGANAALLRHAGRLRARGHFAEVRAAALYGRPQAARALDGLEGRRTYIAPLFMCDGVFVRIALPRALGLSGGAAPRFGRGISLCPPLGLAPGLAPLVLKRAEARARDAGLAPRATCLLLIGHGSPRDPASRQAAQRLAGRLRPARTFAEVRVAFLDEPPRLGPTLAGLRRPAVAVGLFAAAGLHAAEDVPAAIARHARVPICDLGAIGEDPAIPGLVLEQLRKAPCPAAAAWPCAAALAV